MTRLEFWIMEVRCYSTTGQVCGNTKTGSCLFCWVFNAAVMLLIGSLICFPLAFALACDNHYDAVIEKCATLDELIVRQDEKIAESDGDCSHPVIFLVLGGGDENSNVDPFLMVVTIVWRVLDLSISVFGAYLQTFLDGLKLCHTHICVIFVLFSFQIGFSCCELIGLFFSFDVSKYFLIFWPVSNFLRVITCIVFIVRHTPQFFWCYQKDYDKIFLLCDAVGTGVGFMMFDDKLWEILVTLLFETFDAVFALMYTLVAFGTSLSVVWLNVLTIIKIVNLSLKAMITWRSYIWCRYRSGAIFSTITLGLAVLISFLLIQLRFMGVFSTGSSVPLVIPLLVVIPTFAGFTALFARCGVNPRRSVFYSEEERETQKK